MDTLRVLQSHLHEAPTCSLAQWYQRLTEEVGRQVLRPRRNRWYPRVIRRKSISREQETPQTSELSATVKTLCGISSYSLIHGHWALARRVCTSALGFALG